MMQKGISPIAFSGVTRKSEPWILDFRATDHMTGREKLFSSYTPSPRNHRVKFVDGSYTVIAGIGTIEIGPMISLKEVLHVPNVSYNLISIRKITKELNCLVKFSPTDCVFQDRISGRTIGNAKEFNGLYRFEKNFIVNGQAHTTVCNPSLSGEDQIILLHCRLGHPSFLYLKHLFPSLFKKNDSFQCKVCQLAKHKRVSYPSHLYRASKPFALIHNDIWGPSCVRSLTNERWHITFTDDHTQVCWIYLLKDKSETEQDYKNFHSLIKTQYNEDVNVFRTDNGTEYVNSVLDEFLIKHGIIHQSSCVNTPQQNGISERKKPSFVRSC